MKGDLLERSRGHQVGHAPFLAGEWGCSGNDADKDPGPDRRTAVTEQPAGTPLHHPSPVPCIPDPQFFLARLLCMITKCSYEYRGHKEVMLGPVHHHPRAREDPLYEGERIILGALEADHLDQVFGIQSMAPVTDIMAVHATRTRFAHPLAVLTFHLLRLVKVFEIGATDQAAGWRGHVGVIGERGDKDSGKKILDLQKSKANLIRYFSPDFASSL